MAKPSLDEVSKICSCYNSGELASNDCVKKRGNPMNIHEYTAQ